MVKTTKSPAKKAVRKSAKVKDQSKEFADLIVNGMQEKKGKEIVSLDLRNLKNAVADYFVICHADSRPQIEAIARSVEDVVQRATNEKPYHREGFENAEWILLDYVDVVVHIFHNEKRDFYGIERLWADADIKRIAGNY
jgi:ribosome-associated protein